MYRKEGYISPYKVRYIFFDLGQSEIQMYLVVSRCILMYPNGTHRNTKNNDKEHQSGSRDVLLQFFAHFARASQHV